MNRKFENPSDTFGSTMKELVEQQGRIRKQQEEKLRKQQERMRKQQQEKLNKQQGEQLFQQSSLHFQQSGMAQYDDRDKFLFLPDNPAVGSLPPFRGIGVAQLLSDGTFDFIRQPRLRAQSELIRKLAHGRVSKTKDGVIQLTLKVFCDEGVNISKTIATEAELARNAIVEWQLKR